MYVYILNHLIKKSMDTGARNPLRGTVGVIILGENSVVKQVVEKVKKLKDTPVEE